MNLKLKWTNNNLIAHTIEIYRGSAPLDRANLTGLMATLTNGESEWTDTTAVRGNTYYYVFKTTAGNDAVISNNYKIIAVPRRGSGPQVLQYGDYEYGYFGALTALEFLGTGNIRSQVGMTAGTVVTNAPTWHKYARKGKILYVPNKALANYISWDQLYTAGLVFGVDGPGLGSFLPATPVNQLRTVTKGIDTYIVRLMTGYNDDRTDVPLTTENTDDPADGRLCEWNDLIYPLLKYVPNGQRIVNVWNYIYNDMNLASVFNSIVQERASATQNVSRGLNAASSRSAVSARKIIASNTGTSTYGWWPVLELVEDLVVEV